MAKKLRGYTVDEIAESKNRLIRIFGERRDLAKIVYGMVTKVAPSGMSRRLKLFTIYNNSIVNITESVAAVTRKSVRDGELVSPGCGFCPMNDIATSLSIELYGNNHKLEYRWL